MDPDCGLRLNESSICSQMELNLNKLITTLLPLRWSCCSTAHCPSSWTEWLSSEVTFSSVLYMMSQGRTLFLSKFQACIYFLLWYRCRHSMDWEQSPEFKFPESPKIRSTKHSWRVAAEEWKEIKKESRKLRSKSQLQEMLNLGKSTTGLPGSSDENFQGG